LESVGQQIDIFGYLVSALLDTADVAVVAALSVSAADQGSFAPNPLYQVFDHLRHFHSCGL